MNVVVVVVVVVVVGVAATVQTAANSVELSNWLWALTSFLEAPTGLSPTIRSGPFQRHVLPVLCRLNCRVPIPGPQPIV